ncbi:MAG: transposase, partial [Sedimentisphaerales bacterium]|nr:transposase [Sedimentisphaerales bacterium]
MSRGEDRRAEFKKACFAKPRTTNMLERLNEEIKRRTRVAGLFPSEPSL